MVEIIPEDNLSTTSGVITVTTVESFSYMYDELLTWKKWKPFCIEWIFHISLWTNASKGFTEFY